MCPDRGNWQNFLRYDKKRKHWDRDAKQHTAQTIRQNRRRRRKQQAPKQLTARRNRVHLNVSTPAALRHVSSFVPQNEGVYLRLDARGLRQIPMYAWLSIN